MVDTVLSTVSGPIIVLATTRSAVWLIALYFALRYRSWPTILVIGLSWVTNLLYIGGFSYAQQLLAFPYVGLVVYLLCDRLVNQPQHIQSLLAAKEADWSKERHGLINDRAAYEARALLAERKLRDIGDRRRCDD